MNNAGLRKDIALLENDKYSFTEDGHLVLNQVEFGDAGRYYCRRVVDDAIRYEIQLHVHSKSLINIFRNRYDLQIRLFGEVKRKTFHPVYANRLHLDFIRT